jgi:hypothetical protein
MMLELFFPVILILIPLIALLLVYWVLRRHRSERLSYRVVLRVVRSLVVILSVLLAWFLFGAASAFLPWWVPVLVVLVVVIAMRSRQWSNQ